MHEIKRRPGKSRRFAIPREYRKKPGLESGDAFITYLDEAGLYLSPLLRPWRGCRLWCSATFQRGGACPES